MLTEANICLRWLEECGRIDPIFPTEEGRLLVDWSRSTKSRYSAWSLRINPDGHLLFRHGKREVELARFVGERRLINQHGGAILLNGNGFENPDLQGV